MFVQTISNYLTLTIRASPNIGLQRRFGFIQYDCAEVARRASDEMNGFLLEGSRIDVNVASERRKKRNPGEILESVRKIPRYLMKILMQEETISY